MWSLAVSLSLITFVAHAGDAGACSGDEDCSLNGICQSDGTCSCDPAWKGADCGVLDVVENSAQRIYTAPNGDSSWGGLPVWDDETQMYHLFAAEFAKHCGLNNWSPNSIVIRATSKGIMGPYLKQEVVLPTFHHNPTLTRAPDGTWLLYVIGRDVPADEVKDCSSLELADPAPGNRESNITSFSSDSVLGPWNRVGVVIAGEENRSLWDADRTNPSAYATADGQVHLMFRGCHYGCGGERFEIAIAPRWNCSVDVPDGCQYVRQDPQAPLWDVQGEDPFLFRDRRGGWHALIHNLQPNGGFGCNAATWHGCDVGGHAFSRDGLSWTWSPTVAFTTNITWTNGMVEVLNRRERPQLVFADDGVTPIAMVNGVQKRNIPNDHSFTIAVALDNKQMISV